MPAPTVITRTQRWRDRIGSYRPAHELDFDPDRYDVQTITRTAGREFVQRHHYSGSYAATRLQYGLFDSHADRDRQLVGVIALGNGSNARSLTNVFPCLVPYDEALDLSRMTLLDGVPANGETWFMARALRLAAREGIRGLTAFSDPSEFWQTGRDGTLTRIKRGHYGLVYQGGNWNYVGRTRPSLKKYFPTGAEFNGRTLSKFTNGESGRDGVIARLIAAGAPELTDDMDPRAWYELAQRTCGIVERRHEGNHKYAIRVGRTRGERTAVSIALPPLPYPKPTAQLLLANAQPAADVALDHNLDPALGDPSDQRRHELIMMRGETPGSTS